MINIRELAFKALKEIIISKNYSNLVANKYSKGLNTRDKAFFREILYGSLENLYYYEWILSKYSRIKLNKIEIDNKLIILIAIYQILEMDKTPDFAAINEAVKLIGKYSNPGAKKFANGILRNISRNKGNIPKIDKSDYRKYLSIRYSYPLWMINRWVEDYGMDYTEELCIANSKKHSMNIRINSLKADVEDVKDRLRDYKYEIYDSDYLDYSIEIKNPSGILESDLYIDGYIDIQDITSTLATEILNPEPNDSVLDLCAAPGGKTASIAAKMNNRGLISARDINQNKLDLIEKKLIRLGVDIAELKLSDASIYCEEDFERWDKILLDAPCSALGLIRNKAEIKYFKKEEDLEELSKLQYKILQNAAKYLKKNGFLVYSTCSISKRENEDIINRFLKENDDFRLVDFSEVFKDTELYYKSKTGMVQFSPNIHGTNGFFITKLQKCKNNL